MSIGRIAQKPEIIDLHYDQSGTVRVVPADRDIMAMSVETAVEACRAFRQQIQFKDQFEMLLKRLGEWVNARKDRVARAYLTARDSGLLFLVVLRGQKFDETIEDDLTHLDLDIANDRDYSLVSLAVHAIPACSEAGVRSFLSKKLAFRYKMDDDAE